MSTGWVIGGLGLVAGGIGALVGAGGGFLIVPFLLLAWGMDPPQAVATSLVAVTLTGLGSSFAYARQKRIDYSTGWVMVLGMVPGVLVGAKITHGLDPAWFRIAFGGVMASMVVLMVRRSRGVAWTQAASAPGASPTRWGVVARSFRDTSGVLYEYHVDLRVAALVSIFAGALSSAFGIGGGLLQVPVLIAVLGVPAHVATAVSTFVMIFTAFLGLMTHAAMTSLDSEVCLALGVGVLLGSQLGARFSRRLRPQGLTRLVAVGAAILAVVMVCQGAISL